jgi:N-ethylmaleimide reductase
MEGVPSSLAVEYRGPYISEATNISRQGRGYAFTPGIYTDAHVEAWKRVTQAVHDAGGCMVL